MVKTWMRAILLLAGIYNILWGTWVVLFPLQAFELSGAQIPTYPQIWQCVGMIVAVYGLGYILAAYSPFRHWPIILVGLLGKIFGPIGFIYSISANIFPLKFGWNIIFNDLIWIIPFSIILWSALRPYRNKKNIIAIKDTEFEKFETRKRAKFINSLSGYKSCNLIGTCSSSEQSNLSIVSSVFHLGASPALMGFIIRPDSVRRDTLENIRETGSFTLNHVHRDILKKAHQTSARYDKDISEFQECGLIEEYLNGFKAPFVKESLVKIALTLVREEKLPENGTHLIIGSVKVVYLPKELLNKDGNVDIYLANTICVSGLDAYNEVLPIGRLKYAKPSEPTQWV